MGPESSAASDSADYFVTYYRAAARERRSDDGVEHLAWSLPEGIVGGKLEAQARSDAARVDPDLA